MKNSEYHWWDWLTVILFISAQTIAAYRLSDTKWSDDLEIVVTLTVLGLGLGLSLGYSHFSRRTVKLFALGYSLFFSTWQLLLLTPKEYIWAERVWLLGDRLNSSMRLLLANQPLNDAIIFLTFMALLFWFTALTGSYLLTRYGKPWSGLIVTGILMLVMDIYHQPLGKRGFATALYTILALVIATRVYFLQQTQRWQNERAALDSDTGGNVLRGTLVAALVLVLLAWNSPNIINAVLPNSPQREMLLENWQSLRQRLQNATAPLRGSVPVEVEYYGDIFGLGTGSILTDATVFTVFPSLPERSGVPFYWRIRSYDTYTDGHWESTVDELHPYKLTDKFLSYPQYSGRAIIEFRFRPSRSLSMLYAPGLTMQINHAADLLVTSANDQVEDVVAVTVDPLINSGSVYEISASLAAPSIAQLRSAGSQYPEWVSARYLQLPEDLPASIPALAQEIAAGAETPYDQTVLITAWLRENIEYAPVLPQLPQDQDPIEWMLFTQKQAFCNYYATAEVLLLRSLGIPARWVVGYNQGELDESTDESYYRVRDKNRHAWPEVYFPGLGWIEFEPTAAQPDISRPSGDNLAGNPAIPAGQNSPLLEDEAPIRPETTPPADVNMPGTYSRGILTAALILLILVLGLVGLIWWLPYLNRRKRDPEKALPVLIEKRMRARGWRVPRLLIEWSFYTRLTEMERTFYWVRVVNKLAGIPSEKGRTPAEQLQAVVAVLPHTTEEIERYQSEYEREMYSPYPANLSSAQNAMRRIVQAAFEFRWQLIRDRIQNGRNPA